jgi:outer membrane protein assembly factor BamB
MESSSAPRLRLWPAATLVVVYWAFQLFVAQNDMPMFNRFMSNAMGNLAFLLLFLILWLSNGTLGWTIRLSGLGAFLGGTVLAALLAHRSFDPMSFLMTAVPYVLSLWTLWMFVARRTGAKALPLAATLLLANGFFDLLRWNGLDGRLASSCSWRWTTTPEQAFLASRSAPAAGERGTKPWTLRAGDWPEFRGAARDGVVRGVRIETNWREAPPENLWKQPVGPGWSSVIVVDEFLVTQEQRGESEAVVCYEAGTGKEVWAHLEAARFTEGIAGVGPRATPTFHDGKIYAYGANGILVCLDATNGKAAWSARARDEKTPVPMWGYSASPLIADGKVIVFVGGSRGTVAFDAASGAPAWSRDGGSDSYASAQLLTLRSKPQIVMQDNKRMAGLALADGAVLWERANPTPAAIPMLQPHAADEGSLLASTAQDLFLLDVREEGGKWTARDRWVSTRFIPSFDDFIVHDGHVYGLDNGVLSCVKVDSGLKVWKQGRYGSGQVLLLADQALLIVLSEKGELVLVEARPQDPGEAFRFPAIEGKTWNHPVIVRDRIYVRNAAEMACYRLRPLKSP